MKKLINLLFVLPIMVVGQSSDQNYVKTKTYKVPTNSSISDPTIQEASVQIQYFDGLGRPVQQVAYKQSNTGKDIVTFMEYDEFGRQTKEYLPYVRDNATLGIAVSPKSAQASFYSTSNTQLNGNPFFETTAYPYSEKVLEKSLLSRVYEQAAPGETWNKNNGKTIKFDYQTNIENEVMHFTAATVWSSAHKLYNPSFENNAFYDKNQLYKTVTKDENWTSGKNNTTEEFKNQQGQVVLKRTFADVAQNRAVTHDTYYVYDIYGNLTYVIPPLAKLNNINWELCYQYKYDHRNRLVEKKLPGKQWEYIVYNNQDMPVATGPSYNPWGNGAQGWMVSKYDSFGRVIYTGWLQHSGEFSSSARVSFQNNLAATWHENFQSNTAAIDGVSVNYTNTVYPQTMKLLTINYYDRYNHSFAPVVPNQIQNQIVLTNVRSLPTCSWVRVLNDEVQTNAEISHLFYDKKGRSIGSEKFNHLGGYTKTQSIIDFIGKTLNSKTRHKRTESVNELLVMDEFEYTGQDRLLLHVQSINNSPKELITKNNYDELGQLISKEVGGDDVENLKGYQKVDYRYNIRGWLKAINNIDNLTITGENEDLFAFKINYDQVQSMSIYNGTSLFNGNISETYWRSNSDNVTRKYGYSYDAMNRLLAAVYQKPNSNVPVTNMYNETLSYDKNGNIQTLQRNGDFDSDDVSASAVEIDNLVYTYDDAKPNQLKEVTDSSNLSLGFKDENLPDNDTDYNYDENGNMTDDANKGINKIFYNHLNLPTEIRFSNGGIISYLYNATGQKVQKTVTTSTATIMTDYLDGFQYVNNALNFFPHAEGFVDVKGTNAEGYKYFYVYNYTDHLGNIRVSYGFDPDTKTVKTLEENHYYPFGLKHTNYNTYKRGFKKEDPPINAPPTSIPGLVVFSIKQVVPGEMLVYKYKYNGKELQDELNLNLYDYGARNYDPAIGRWMNIDPLAEKYFEMSPYTYAANNPIYFIDPDGKQIDINFTYQQDKKGNDILDKDGNRILSGVNINVTGKIINFSDNNIDMKQALSDITSSLEESFSGMLADGVKVITTTDFEVANSMDDVSESDHLIVFGEASNSNVYGGSNFLGGKVAFVEGDYFTGLWDTSFGKQGERTTTHEVGHLFGLEHTRNGLMRQGGSATNITAKEFGTIIKNYKSGKLNHGSNSDIFGLPNRGQLGSDTFNLENTNGRTQKTKK